MASSNSHINKPHHGRPKRAELMDVNINTGTQNVNTERPFLSSDQGRQHQCGTVILFS